MACKTPACGAGILLFACRCSQNLEIRTVNHWLFIYLCNLSSAFLRAVQFCTGAVKEGNITAYRNWTSWHATILFYMFGTANCLPWVTGTTLTYPYCQRVLTKIRTELANWSTVWLISLIVIAINFLTSKFINMTVTAEVWLKIHAKLSVFVGLLPWYTAIFICLHFFNSFIYVKMTLLRNFNGFRKWIFALSKDILLRCSVCANQNQSIIIIILLACSGKNCLDSEIYYYFPAHCSR